MTASINETHDAQLRSWVQSANTSDTDFPIQNLPFGVFRLANSTDYGQCGVRIGDEVLDVWACYEAGLLENVEREIVVALSFDKLNYLMEDANKLSPLRLALSRLLRAGDRKSEVSRKVARYLHPINEVEMLLPAAIGDYTDFYASIYHATNVGKMFRPDNPLLPNYKYVPIGYHGRASSIVVSGTPVRRPLGQTEPREGDDAPAFAPSRLLDYELEVGFFVGQGNTLGEPVSIDEAASRIFGLCLVNDWSARDVQKWEYQPLGPFLAKNFATSISAWVVTTEALAPYRTPAFARPAGDPAPLSYLSSEADQARGGIDLKLVALLSSQKMRDEGHAPQRLSQSNLRDLYWTSAQMLAHHASNGCNLRAGDLFASGTVSGATETERGCLLELTARGASPIELPTGETRRFLEDGDEVIFRGYCEREGFARIGFGECRGVVLPGVA